MDNADDVSDPPLLANHIKLDPPDVEPECDLQEERAALPQPLEKRDNDTAQLDTHKLQEVNIKSEPREDVSVQPEFICVKNEPQDEDEGSKQGVEEGEMTEEQEAESEENPHSMESTTKDSPQDEEDEHRCSLCSKRFAQKRYMVQHFKRQHTDPVLECSFCHYETRVPSLLLQHMLNQHSRQFMQIQGTWNIQDNIKAEQPETERILAAQQHEEMRRQSRRMRIMKGIHKPGREKHRVEVQCPVCGKSLIDKKILHEHMRRQHRDPLLCCSMCPYKNRRQAVLTQHILDKHQNSSVQQEYEVSNFPDKQPVNRVFNQEYEVSNSPDTQPGLGTHFLFQHSDTQERQREEEQEEEERSEDFDDSTYDVQSTSSGTSGTSMYACETCGRGFKSKQLLRKHTCDVPTGKPSTIYRCPTCGHRLKSRKYLHEHVRRQHMDPLIGCGLCDFETRRKPYLLYHMRKKHAPDTTSLHLIQEQDTPQGDSKAQDKLEASSSSTANTSEETFPPKSVKVKRMRRNTPQNTEKSSHSRVQRDKMLRCNVCKYHTKKKFALEQHMITHMDNKFTCKICNKTMGSVSSLNTHEKNMHPDAYKLKRLVFKCKECNVKFMSQQMLDKHVKNHDEGRKFKCDLCPGLFKTERCLQIHKGYVHVEDSHKQHRRGKVAVQCKLCDKMLSSKSSLVYHETYVHGLLSFTS